MANSRADIRAAIVSTLDSSGLGMAVTGMRFKPYDFGELPAVSVYSLTESAEPDGDSTQTYRRTATITLEITAAESVADLEGSLADSIDGYCALVEAAMATDYTFGGEVDDCVYTGTSLTFTEENETTYARAQLSYDVVYYTVEISNETATLAGLDVTYDLESYYGNESVNNHAEDTIG